MLSENPVSDSMVQFRLNARLNKTNYLDLLLFPFILIALLMLVSTAGMAAETGSKDETISRGWQLILNQDIRIPEQSAGIYLQNGKVKSESEIDLYYPNCRLEVRDLHNKPQTIKADTFIVYRVNWIEEDVLLHSNLYAASGIIQVSSPTADDYITTLDIRSEQQSNVTRLICRHWEDPTGFAEHLTLRQIRSALGEIFTLTPP